MKNFSKLLLCFSLIAHVLSSSALAQKTGKDPRRLVTNLNVATSDFDQQITFFPGETVEKAVIQVDYTAISGDSVEISFYVSASGNYYNISPLNDLSVLDWESGDSANVTLFDTIRLIDYPVYYLRTVVDTFSIDNGRVSVWVKPIFKE